MGACGPSPSPPTESDRSPSTTVAAPDAGPFGDIPEDARISKGGSAPRSAGYWISWSTCGEDSQADVAAENGGAAAGWTLVDDVLRDPGITLGDREVISCEEAIAVLSRTPQAVAPEQQIHSLARAVLTAELNLSTGSETCDAVETAIGLGHLLLSSSGSGPDGINAALDDRERDLVGEIRIVLDQYNAGTLCR